MSEKNNDIDFEVAMKRLDKITEELSCDGVKLEEALKLYEEGVKLVKVCNKKLEDTERKIKILKMTSDGELCEEDLTFAENN